MESERVDVPRRTPRRLSKTPSSLWPSAHRLKHGKKERPCRQDISKPPQPYEGILIKSNEPIMNDQEELASREPDIDTYRLCSCCLELVCLKSLWAEYVWMGCTEVYGNMLKDCFNLDWTPSDKIQEQICEVCITQLRNAVYFKQKVLQSQARIKSKLFDVMQPLKNENVQNEPEVYKSASEVFMKESVSGYNEQNNGDDDYDVNDDQLTDDDNPIKAEDDERIDVEESDIFKDGGENDQSIKAEDIDMEESDIFKDGSVNSKQRKPFQTKREKEERRKMNYIRPRQNISLILEHSTILPFKSNRGYFNCLYCNKQFASFNELKSHVTEAHENNSFKSIIKSIRRPKDRIRADVSDINCRICKRKIDNLDYLIKHLTEEHSVKFNFDNNVKPSYCIIPYVLSDGKNKCYQCKAEFLFFKTLSKHMNEHSTEHVCDICGKCFLLADRLRAHVQTHTEGKTVKCEICGKICNSKTLLKSHIRFKHQKISFMCSICNEIFPTCKTRMLHLEEVHKRTPLNLTCKVCSKNFGAPNSLNSHMRLEHINLPREPKHCCGVCGMMFKTRNGLNNHLIVHSDEKNFECDICHKKYARAKTLTEHLKIHMNDRRWTCGACSQAFVQKCSLENHIRVHHSDVDVEQLIVYKKPND